MGRPRKYDSHADRQAAYRARLAQDRTWVLVNRRSLELLEGRLERLRDAMHGAAAAGAPLPGRCCAVTADTCVDKLTAYFEAQTAAVPGGKSPGR